MNFFSKFEIHSKDNCATTKGFFIGAAEAEAEATTTPILLHDFFEDYLEVLPKFGQEKFILLGRKGCGKSAIGEYIYQTALQEANVFCAFVKKSDIDIESIVQIGQEEGIVIEQEMLYRWVILTQLLKLFAKNEALKNHDIIKPLTKFYETNRGFVDIRNQEVKEIIRENGFDVKIEHLRRAASLGCTNKIHTKESKAPFYKYLPTLEELVINILKKDVDNEYFLIFDDLDIDFDCNNSNSLNVLASLLRVAKSYNCDIFSRNGISAKIILLLRTDIANRLLNHADTAKIFASYAITLKWYEDLLRFNEKQLLLRKFINRRIKINFERKGLLLNYPDDAWTSFVDESSFIGDNKTGFKTILDYTFYRPRDLVLFFKDLDRLALPLPLTREKILTLLLNNYSEEAINDLKNELSTLLTSNEIESILCSLRNFTRAPFDYITLQSNLVKNGISQACVGNVIKILFDYSLIGNYSEENGVSFKFREKNGMICNLNTDESIILHNLLRAYFKHH